MPGGWVPDARCSGSRVEGRGPLNNKRRQKKPPGMAKEKPAADGNQGNA